MNAEIYNWVDKKRTINLTDGSKRILEKFKDRVETILVGDKYEDPVRPPEKTVVPPIPEPERPKV